MLKSGWSMPWTVHTVSVGVNYEEVDWLLKGWWAAPGSLITPPSEHYSAPPLFKISSKSLPGIVLRIWQQGERGSINIVHYLVLHSVHYSALPGTIFNTLYCTTRYYIQYTAKLMHSLSHYRACIRSVLFFIIIIIIKSREWLSLINSILIIQSHYYY